MTTSGFYGSLIWRYAPRLLIRQVKRKRLLLDSKVKMLFFLDAKFGQMLLGRAVGEKSMPVVEPCPLKQLVLSAVRFIKHST